jgi:hypothetical protein
MIAFESQHAQVLDDVAADHRTRAVLSVVRQLSRKLVRELHDELPCDLDLRGRRRTVSPLRPLASAS